MKLRILTAANLLAAGVLQFFVAAACALNALRDPVGAQLTWVEHHVTYVDRVAKRIGSRRGKSAA